MKRKKETTPINICISGSPRSDTKGCSVDALEIARELGREIAKHDITLASTTTTGFALWAAIGAKEAKGKTVAFSPAASLTEHIETYKLPIDSFDFVVYSGFGVTGASVLALRSCDAVIFGCGGLSSIIECTEAVRQNKIIGILEGDWDTDEILEELLAKNYGTYNHVIRDADPRRLVEQIIKRARINREDLV